MRSPRQLLVVMMIGITIIGLSQEVPKAAQPQWLAKPKQLTSQADDSVAPAVRAARSTLHNSAFGDPLDTPVTHNPNEPVRSTASFNDYYAPNPYPVNISDAIVIASATDVKPFLTGDHRRIYSELSFRPSTVLKDSEGNVSPMQSLTVIQDGGTAILPSGKSVMTTPSAGANAVDIATPYLLFLHYLADSQAYIVVQAWKLTNAAPKALDFDGHPLPDRALHSAPPQSTTDLVAAVKAKLD